MRRIRLLIDGYNLLFQSEHAGKARGRGWLDRARRRLLMALIQGLSPDEAAATTVVFDASQFAETSDDFVFEDKLEVRFARDHPEADDLLEELIRRAPQPKLLRVVSSDQRVRRCARARRAESLDSETFLRQLEAARTRAEREPLEEPQPPDDEPLPPSEVDYWLKKFNEPPGKP